MRVVRRPRPRRYDQRRPAPEVSRCRTCSARGAGWRPAPPPAARSPSSPSTTARTCAGSSIPDDPAATTYAEMVDFKRAVVRALAATATGTLLDPEIGAAQCIADGSLPGAGRPHRRRSRRPATRARQPPASAASSPAGRSSRRSGWAPRRRSSSSTTTPTPPNAADQERLVADGRGRLPGRRPGPLRRAARVRPGDRREADRRGAPALRRGDRAAAHGPRRRRPQGRVPVRPGRDRRGGLGGRVRRARRRLAGPVGPPLRAASTTRRSSARSPSPAGPAPRASSSGARSGRRRRRCRRRPATPGWRPRAGPASGGSSDLVDEAGPCRGTRGPGRSRRRRRPARAGTGNTERRWTRPRAGRAATSTSSSSARSTRTSSSRAADPRPVFGQVERWSTRSSW